MKQACFADRLEPLGRILDCSDDGWAVWCCSPIWGPDGKVHVFFARTPERIQTWKEQGEIAHATADRPEGPYTVHGTVIKGRGPGHWDSHGLINPRVYAIDGRYALFYNAEGDPSLPEMERTRGIGLCLSEDLWHWHYANDGERLLGPAPDRSAWDGNRCDNPAFIKHPDNGEYWLYYSGSQPRDAGNHDSPGLVRATALEGPYQRFLDHPVIDSTKMLSRNAGTPFRGLEDPCVWIEDARFHMLVHDLGYDGDEEGGWLFTSDDGLNWSGPELGYRGTQHYLGQRGQAETPLVLKGQDGRVEYLFINTYTYDDMKYTGFVLRVR